MSVKECSPLCFGVVLKGFSELYFQTRISFPFGNIIKSCHSPKWLFTVWKSYSSKKSPWSWASHRAQIQRLWEYFSFRGVIGTLSHPAVLIAPCVSCACLPCACLAGTSKCILGPFTVAIRNISQISQALKCVTSISLYYVQDGGLPPLPLWQQS